MNISMSPDPFSAHRSGGGGGAPHQSTPIPSHHAPTSATAYRPSSSNSPISPLQTVTVPEEEGFDPDSVAQYQRDQRHRSNTPLYTNDPRSHHQQQQQHSSHGSSNNSQPQLLHTQQTQVPPSAAKQEKEKKSPKQKRFSLRNKSKSPRAAKPAKEKGGGLFGRRSVA